MSELRLAIINLLNETTHTAKTIIRIIARACISFLLMDKISPIKYPEYFENPHLADNITIPSAIPAEENTPIIVSDEDIFDSIILDIPSANKIENPIIDIM